MGGGGNLLGLATSRGSGDDPGVRPLVIRVRVEGLVPGLLLVLPHQESGQRQVLHCGGKGGQG